MSILEDAVIDYLEERAALRAFVAALLAAPLSDRELIAMLMWLEGHSLEATGRVMPQAYRDGNGVSRQNVAQARASAKRKLIARGAPIASLEFDTRYSQEVTYGRKWCPKCGRKLPVRDFHRNRHAPSGWHWYCRACTEEMKRDERALRRKGSAAP